MGSSSSLQSTSGAALNPGLQRSIHRLMDGVADGFGIRATSQMETKLVRIFQNTQPAMLDAWIADLETKPATHPEWLGLVESLTVHETYFCRDKPQLQFLRDRVIMPLIKSRSGLAQPSIHLWSAACSTGEETYTLCMVLLDALLEQGQARQQADGSIVPLPHWRIRVLGTDLSRQVLRTAESATYSNLDYGSFRAMDARWMTMFEDAPAPPGTSLPGATYRRVRPLLREMVRFAHHNLLEREPPAQDMDVVVCRNVFIYFDDDKRRTAQCAIARALAPGGVLLMGGTDRLVCQDKFIAVTEGGFAFYSRR